MAHNTKPDSATTLPAATPPLLELAEIELQKHVARHGREGLGYVTLLTLVDKLRNSPDLHHGGKVYAVARSSAGAH